ncbi:YjgN family protein [Deinococcus sp.]|uniref:YjgN family protein n=1 Tax=Deinococcus sp. TaxID=47478 RepID=UPI003CC6781F
MDDAPPRLPTDPEGQGGHSSPTSRMDLSKSQMPSAKSLSAQTLPAQTPPPAPPQITTLPLRFTGEAGEFFRIWIVNVLLSVVTLGIYSPWARVRTRQYFYGHTWLDGHNFEYTAQPLALLRGFLIVGGLFVVYSVSQRVERYQWISFVLLGVFFVLYPWLVYRSLRFNAANTVYRGLKFRFHGTAGAAYVAYLLIMLSVPFTLGTTYPLAVWFQRRYLLENAAYGNAHTRWGKEVGPVYLTFLIALAVSIGIAIALYFLILVTVVAVWGLGGLSGAYDHLDEAGISRQGSLLIGLVGVVYVLFLLISSTLWQYVRAALLKYSLQDLYVGETLRLQAVFNPLTLAWIGVSNLLAQIVTLGLLTPWAAVRRTRYLLEGVQVQTIASLDEFSADASGSESALGEAAHEFFNFDLGF